MSPALTHTDEFLRGVGPFDPDARAARPWWWLPVMVLAFAPIYGGLMGSFQFDSPEHILQVIYAGSKIPLLLFATSLICLPGFFVLNTILGLRDDFRAAQALNQEAEEEEAI